MVVVGIVIYMVMVVIDIIMVMMVIVVYMVIMVIVIWMDLKMGLTFEGTGQNHFHSLRATNLIMRS